MKKYLLILASVPVFILGASVALASIAIPPNDPGNNPPGPTLSDDMPEIHKAYRRCLDSCHKSYKLQVEACRATLLNPRYDCLNKAFEWKRTCEKSCWREFWGPPVVFPPDLFLPNGKSPGRDSGEMEETVLNIPAGDNQFKVVDAGFNVQLPADFFGPGSEPFEDTIICQGDDDSFPDTIIERRADINLPPPPSEDTIPIEMVELNLVSCQPITVNNNDGNQQQWSVNVGLSLSSPLPDTINGLRPLGQMTIKRAHENGGTFDSQLSVQPRFTFTRIDDLITPPPIGIVIIEDIVIDAFEASDISWQACPSPDPGFIFDFCPEGIRFFSDDSWLNLEPIMPTLDEDNSDSYGEYCRLRLSSDTSALINPIQYDINGDGAVDDRDVSALQSLMAVLTGTESDEGRIDNAAGADSPEKELTSGDLMQADVNSDSVIDEKDTKLLEELLKSFVDINGDGVIDRQDTQRITDICPDADADAVIDSIDNCPFIANPEQSDLDTDDLGDVCDNCPNDPVNDVDGDGVCGDVDNCPLENPQGLDANLDGCTDTIEGLYDTLQSTEIQDRVKNSLLAKVNSVLSSLTIGRVNAAINQLGAFINQVEAQSGKKVSQKDATVLVNFAQNIIQLVE